MEERIAHKLSVLLDWLADAPLYDKVTALNNLAGVLLEDLDLLDYPELNAEIESIQYSTEEWMEEHEPSEEEKEAREVVEAM